MKRLRASDAAKKARETLNDAEVELDETGQSSEGRPPSTGTKSATFTRVMSVQPPVKCYISVE